VGILLAVWIIPPLVAVLPSEVPRADLISIDRSVLLFTLVLSVGAIVLFGLLPALRATGERVHDALKQGLSKGSFGSRRQRFRSALVVAEIALSAVLVLGAGLTLKSLWHLQRVDPGLNPEHLVTMRVTPPEARYSDEESVKAYYAQVEQRLAAVPGVTQTAMINYLPLSGSGVSMRFFPQESPVSEDELPTYANCRAVSPDYFLTMGIPLVAGRAFESGEGIDPPRVVISRTAANIAWPGEDPIGKQIEVPVGIEEHFTVIGVVDDVHQFSLEDQPRADMYFPYEWWTSSRMYLTIRVAGDPEAQIPILRAAIWSVDRDVPIASARSMDEVIDGTTADSRLLAILLACFGLLALSLGAIGVYGVVSYAVSQSTYEIGVRMALGAGKQRVMSGVLRYALTLAGIGIVLGIGGGLVAGRVLSSLLFGVSVTDPFTFLAVGVVLSAVAVVASYLPAHRASRVDPLVAIRME
jgi:predicted permease